MENYKIPLRNKEKEIIDYTFVSKEDFDTLNKFRWYKNTDGYVINSSTKNNRIHRYIIIDILKNDIDSHTFVDHINNNRLDNRRENLRIVTHSKNSRNIIKNKKYYGVSYQEKRKMFRCRLKINKNTPELNAYYTIEEHAAYQYDLWIKKHNVSCGNINNIKKPKKFVEYIPKKKKEKLPIGVTRDRDTNKYILQFNKKYIRRFNSIEEASNKYQALLIEYNKSKLQKILNEPILRNKDNQCIIQIFNKKKEKVTETIVDDEDYYKLKQYSWYKTKDYVAGHINSKNKLIHRYILNYDGKDVVDHINNNPLDNRKCNLRIVTKKQNSMNVSVSKNATSKYIGVSWCKNSNKWSCQISVNRKKIHLGLFEKEDDAARCRDIATKKHFGEHGKLNFP